MSESDIVGALFGQTEGLLEDELELKQLQKSGRIGRIDFKISSKKGESKGKISIPSSLNKISTAILAATLESVERVGPCSCTISLDKIVDVRKTKRDQIAKRASEIMKKWNVDQQETTLNIAKFVEKDSRKGKVVVFGPDKLNAGPEIFKSQEIIVVEGRADIINLLKMNIENTIALDGTKVPSTIKNLCRSRTVTVLLDGDRGGDMILKELILSTDIDHVARAPYRKEVEDLSSKEVKKALEKKLPVLEAEFMSEKLSVSEFLDKQSSRPRKSYQRDSDRDSSRRDSRRDDRRDSSRRDSRSDDRRDSSRRDSRSDDRRDSSRKDSRRDDRRDSSRRDSRRDDRRDSSRRDSRRDDRRDSSRRDSRRDNRRDSSRRDSRGGRRDTRGNRNDSRGRDSRNNRRHQVFIPNEIKSMIGDVKQTATAVFLSNEFKTIATAKTSEAYEHLQRVDNVSSIIIDGVITQRMLDVANKKSVKLITGAVIGALTNRHKIPEIATFNRIR